MPSPIVTSLKIRYTIITLTSILCALLLFFATQLINLKTPLPHQQALSNGNEFLLHTVEKINNNRILSIKGWFTNLDPTISPRKTNISVILSSKERSLSIPTQLHQRPDVMKHFNIPFAKRNLGFSASIIKILLEKGEYQIYLQLHYDDKIFLVKSDKTIIL